MNKLNKNLSGLGPSEQGNMEKKMKVKYLDEKCSLMLEMPFILIRSYQIISLRIKNKTQTKWKSEVWPWCVSVSLPGWAKADNVVGMFHLKGIVNGSGYKRATLDFYLCLALTFFFFPQSCGWTDFKAQARLSLGIIWPQSLVTLTLWAHTRGSSV